MNPAHDSGVTDHGRLTGDSATAFDEIRPAI